jgi:hypothetical protein
MIMGKFTSETARIAGQKSKRGRAKRDPIVHDAMEILLTEGMAKLYEKMDELNASQLLKLVQISANYVLPKAKPQMIVLLKSLRTIVAEIGLRRRLISWTRSEIASNYRFAARIIKASAIASLFGLAPM